MRKTTMISLLCSALLGVVGCGNGSSTQASSQAQTAPAESPTAPPSPNVVASTPPAVASPAVAAPSHISDPSFELRATSTDTFHAGQPGKVQITLEAKGGYHVNQEYPIAVTLAGDGLTFAKPALARADATEFGEHVARFEATVTPSATGQRTVRADIDFAVCTAQNCMPDNRTIALALDVQ